MPAGQPDVRHKRKLDIRRRDTVLRALERLLGTLLDRLERAIDPEVTAEDRPNFRA